MNAIAMLMLAVDLNGQPLPDVVLLDFTAGYCQPCQQMVPMLQRMERDKFPVRKIDITQQPDVSREYGVDRIPTLILLVEGKEARRFVGLTAEDELRRAMNDAARKLEMKRKANSPEPVADPPSSADDEPSPEDFASREPVRTPVAATVAATTEDSPRPGIRGVFDRMRRGLGGGAESPDRDQMERPDFRAQSPDEETLTTTNDSLPMRATVRVRLDEGEFKDVGTGTIIYSTTGQSTILTCAHIFKDVSADAVVVVEAFRDGEAFKYPAQVLGGDHDADIAFLSIRNTSPLPVAPLVPGRLNVQPNESVFSIGCNAGNRPTQLNMKIAKINFFEGPENIVCDVDPVQGRSGGGLFNASGELIGVCSGAFRDTKEGLYSGVGAVRNLMSKLNLNSLFETDAASFAADEPKAPAPRPASNPFAENDSSFEQMFEQHATQLAAASAPAPAAAPAFEDTAPRQPPVTAFADPPPRTTLVSTGGHPTPAEITVIIDSPDPAQGKRVVVIPRPSPWLLQLLTGETPSENPGGAKARSAVLSTTTARRTERSGNSASDLRPAGRPSLTGQPRTAFH